jgi:hypothetical protein
MKLGSVRFPAIIADDPVAEAVASASCGATDGGGKVAVILEAASADIGIAADTVAVVEATPVIIAGGGSPASCAQANTLAHASINVMKLPRVFKLSLQSNPIAGSNSPIAMPVKRESLHSSRYFPPPATFPVEQTDM